LMSDMARLLLSRRAPARKGPRRSAYHTLNLPERGTRRYRLKQRVLRQAVHRHLSTACSRPRVRYACHGPFPYVLGRGLFSSLANCKAGRPLALRLSFCGWEHRHRLRVELAATEVGSHPEQCAEPPDCPQATSPGPGSLLSAGAFPAHPPIAVVPR